MNSTLIISPDIHSPAIINNGTDPVNIDGTEIIIDFEGKQGDIIDIIKKAKKYEYIIIDGSYEGKFSNLKILNDKKVCEKINGVLKEKESVYSAILTVDNSGCKGIKWWAVLLIVIGISAIIISIFIVVVLMNKDLRRKILPFNRELRNNIDDNSSDDENLQSSSLYHGKSKRNPLYTL